MKEVKEKEDNKKEDDDFFDYEEIEELRRIAWANKQVQKNWREYHKRQREKTSRKND